MPAVSHKTRRTLLGSTFALRVGFTLLEILVSVAVLAIVLAAMLALLNTVSSSYQRTAGKLEAFESARVAFEALTRTVKQATLLSRLGYDDPAQPASWELQSDLHFISGAQSLLGFADNTGTRETHAIFFQAPQGVVESSALRSANALVTSTGFFLAWGEDPTRPTILKTGNKTPSRHRFRLFQYMQPKEKMTVYENTLRTLSDGQQSIIVGDKNFSGTDWFNSDVNVRRYCHPLAENVIALAILPITQGDSAQEYLWNSRDSGSAESHHRLPQSLRVLMVAIDENSMARLNEPESAPQLLPAGLFEETAKFEEDVKSLETHFANYSPALNYRIFTADIPLEPSNTNL